MREMRKQLGWYLRGLPASAMVREQLQALRTEADVLRVLAAYEELLAQGKAVPSARDFGAGLVGSEALGGEALGRETMDAPR